MLFLRNIIHNSSFFKVSILLSKEQATAFVSLRFLHERFDFDGSIYHIIYQKQKEQPRRYEMYEINQHEGNSVEWPGLSSFRDYSTIGEFNQQRFLAQIFYRFGIFWFLSGCIKVIIHIWFSRTDSIFKFIHQWFHAVVRSRSGNLRI